MTNPTATSSPLTVDPNGCIAVDIACVRCGYNLRTLRQEATCPECGTAVERSLQGNLLCLADPEWVGRLARGLNWTVKGIYGAIGILIGMFMVYPSGVNMFTLLIQTCGCAALVGYWQFSRPEPSRSDEGPILSARKVSRLGLCGAVLAGMLAYRVVGRASNAAVDIPLVYLLPGVLMTIGFLGLFRHLEQLARRIPDLELGRRTRSARNGLATSLVLFLALAAVSWVAQCQWGGVGADFARIHSFVTFAVAIAFLVCAGLSLRLLARYQKRLRAVLEQAGQN